MEIHPKAKMNGAKKGDKVKGRDGKEITPQNVTEFVLSMYDPEQDSFQKEKQQYLQLLKKILEKNL